MNKDKVKSTEYEFQDGLKSPPDSIDINIDEAIKKSKVEFPEQVEQQLAFFSLDILKKAQKEYISYGDSFIQEYRDPIDKQIKLLEKVKRISRSYLNANQIYETEEEEEEVYEEDSSEDTDT